MSRSAVWNTGPIMGSNLPPGRTQARRRVAPPAITTSHPNPAATRRRAFFEEMCPRTHKKRVICSEASARCGDLIRKETSSGFMPYNAISIEARTEGFWNNVDAVLAPCGLTASVVFRERAGCPPISPDISHDDQESIVDEFMRRHGYRAVPIASTSTTEVEFCRRNLRLEVGWPC